MSGWLASSEGLKDCLKLPSSKNGIKDGKNCGNSYGDCDGVKKTLTVLQARATRTVRPALALAAVAAAGPSADGPGRVQCVTSSSVLC